MRGTGRCLDHVNVSESAIARLPRRSVHPRLCLCVRYPVVGSRRQDSVIGMRNRRGSALCGSRKCKPAPSSVGSVGLTTSLGHMQSLVCAVHSKKCRIKSSLGLSLGSKYGPCMDIHLCRCSSHLSWPEMILSGAVYFVGAMHFHS